MMLVGDGTVDPDVLLILKERGGKWAAYDLMHFEYRPEIVLKSRWREAEGQGK